MSEEKYVEMLEDGTLYDYITNLQDEYEKEHYLVDKLTRQLNDEYKNTEYQCKQKEDLTETILDSTMFKLECPLCLGFTDKFEDKARDWFDNTEYCDKHCKDEYKKCWRLYFKELKRLKENK